MLRLSASVGTHRGQRELESFIELFSRIDARTGRSAFDSLLLQLLLPLLLQLPRAAQLIRFAQPSSLPILQAGLGLARLADDVVRGASQELAGSHH